MQSNIGSNVTAAVTTQSPAPQNQRITGTVQATIAHDFRDRQRTSSTQKNQGTSLRYPKDILDLCHQLEKLTISDSPLIELNTDRWVWKRGLFKYSLISENPPVIRITKNTNSLVQSPGSSS